MSDLTIILISAVILAVLGLGGLFFYGLGLIKRITEETVTLRQESTELTKQSQLQQIILQSEKGKILFTQ